MCVFFFAIVLVLCRSSRPEEGEDRTVKLIMDLIKISKTEGDPQVCVVLVCLCVCVFPAFITVSLPMKTVQICQYV